MGTITVNLDDVMLNLSGNVVDCSNNPVTKGDVNQNPINGTGTFTPYLLSLIYGNFQGGSNTYQQGVPATLNVTNFGPVNGFITGTFGGNITDSATKQVYPLSGNFKIKRTN